MKRMIAIILCVAATMSPVDARDYETVEEYIADYPKFDEAAATRELQAEAERKFKLYKEGEEIKVATKSRTYEGQYFKVDGAIKVGGREIPFFDLSPDQRAMFDDESMLKRRREYVKAGLFPRLKQYDERKVADAEAFREKLEMSGKTLTLGCKVLHNPKVVEATLFGVKLKHDQGELSLKFSDMSTADLARFKSGQTLAIAGEMLKDVKVLALTPSSVTLVCDGGPKRELSLSSLPEKSQKLFNYSKEADEEYQAKLAVDRENAKLDPILFKKGKYTKRTSLSVFQGLPVGALCLSPEHGLIRVFEYKLSEKPMNYIMRDVTLYYVGEITYPTQDGGYKTVDGFALSKQNAYFQIKIMLGNANIW